MPAIALNEDSTNFFARHRAVEMSAPGLDAWVDQYVGTQVRELVLNTNCQRSSFDSKAKQPIWDGFDPEADNDQPFFAGITHCSIWPSMEDLKAHMRRWVHHSLLLHQQGLDPFARWIARSRFHGISPWITMRMNDVHYVDQPDHCIHDRFWKEHPEYRRDPARGYNGQCLDYGRPEVRAYQMAYARELVARYDMDGFELDWMRNPYYFKPGHEEVGSEILTGFIAEVRELLDSRALELGHPIHLSARVPSRPETARRLGMDAVTWSRRKLIDRLVVTPFLHVEFDMPIELWKQLLEGTDVILAAGLYPTLRAYSGGERKSVNPEAARGAAIAQLDRGADMIYLFNFMDHSPTQESRKAYQLMLREIGALETMAGKSRRHVLTSPDHWAPGEVEAEALPRDCATGGRSEFRIHVGPAPLGKQSAQVRMELEGQEAGSKEKLTVRVNGEACPLAGRVPAPPGWMQPTCAFDIPAAILHRGYNRIEVKNSSPKAVRLTWMELAISRADGHWQRSGIEIQPLY